PASGSGAAPGTADAGAGDAEAGDAGAQPSWETNRLLARLGLRVLPHAPCRPGCPASRELAHGLVALGEAAVPQETAWLREILSWPMAGSALHGIWEVKTPVLKLLADAEWTAAPRIATHPGTAFPAEGARGVRFPFDTSRLTRLGRAGTRRQPVS
ncbi:MAG TPA: hypothetical protein VHQ65_00155, partial [Thermoanaerobaculia bacterium]|nr:hypothetical protein [Thermoanaerobaculia bacterium]